ncbi:MAG TPA: hypothetical protein VL500_02670 [Candidatus Eisenbacteria bacterium]|jgi:hypothetical protein|nr:hypothetical protein [Candidatus Eisenbacteria bacterium]
MIGTPLTAKDWDHELDTKAGEAIVRVLMPFHEIPLQLSEPEAHLTKEVPASLLGLGLPSAKASIVSRQAFMAGVDALPEHCRRAAAMGLAVGLSESLSRPVVDLLDKHVERTPSYDDVFRLLHASLFDAFVGRMDRDFGKLSNTGTRLGLQQSLCSQIAALADGRPDLAAKAQPFSFLYRAGNWPLGIMKDGDFLVLVR